MIFPNYIPTFTLVLYHIKVCVSNSQEIKIRVELHWIRRGGRRCRPSG